MKIVEILVQTNSTSRHSVKYWKSQHNLLDKMFSIIFDVDSNYWPNSSKISLFLKNNNQEMTLEICAYNIQSCLIAQKSGANRIEFCADPLGGGITPSYGAVAFVMEKLEIPVYPIIRPRGGDFVYSDDELEVMKRDIAAFKQLGCKGISTGAANRDNTIDVVAMKRIREWAYPMELTCHKVFDGTPDLFVAIEMLIESGCTRVLTSGGKGTAAEGSDIIKQLVVIAGDRINIMPGGSVRSANIAQLIATTNATEYHSSAIVTDDNNYFADEGEIRCILKVMRS